MIKIIHRKTMYNNDQSYSLLFYSLQLNLKIVDVHQRSNRLH